MNYPARWREYVDSMKAVGSSPAPSYAAWASRFRAAKSLTGMTFDELSPASVDAYFLATKLSFVDSAFEALENASDSDVGSLELFDQDIAYSIWEDRLAELSQALPLLNNRKLASQWREFCELDKDQVQIADLRFLLRAFRHLNAHGVFTPGSASVYQSKKLRGLLFQLAEVGLKQMESHFSSFLDEGALPIAQASSESMEQISSAKLQGSFYIGSVIGVEEMTDGQLLLQRTEKLWQILNMKDWSLSAPLSDKPGVVSLRATHDFRVSHEGISKVIATVANSDYVIWQLTDGEWLIGTAKSFTKYNPVTRELGPSIASPRDMLPKYLNYGTLGLARDGSFAIVGLDSLERTYLFLDLVKMQARQIKIPGIPAAYHAKYLGLTEVMVSLDEANSSLNFYSAKPFQVPESGQEHDLRPLEMGVTRTISLGGARNPWSSRTDVYKDMFRVSGDGLALAKRSGVSFWRMDIMNHDDSRSLFSLPERSQAPFISENLDFVVDSKFDNIKSNIVFRTDSEGTSQIELPSLRWALFSSHFAVTNQLIFVGRKNGAVALVDPNPLTLSKEVETTLDGAHAASMLSESSVAVLGRANGRLVIQLWDIETDRQLDSRTICETGFSYRMTVDHLGGRIWLYAEHVPGITVIDIETLEIQKTLNQENKTQEVWIDQINRRAYVLRRDDLTLQVLNADKFLEEDVRGLPSQGVRLSYAAESKELFIACEHGFLAKLAL